MIKILNQVKEKYTENKSTIVEGKEYNINLLNNKISSKDKRTTTGEISICKFTDHRKSFFIKDSYSRVY